MNELINKHSVWCFFQHQRLYIRLSEWGACVRQGRWPSEWRPCEPGKVAVGMEAVWAKEQTVPKREIEKGHPKSKKEVKDIGKNLCVCVCVMRGAWQKRNWNSCDSPGGCGGVQKPLPRAKRGESWAVTSVPQTNPARDTHKSRSQLRIWGRPSHFCFCRGPSCILL